MTVTATASVKLRMQPVTLHALLESDVLEQARHAATFAARHAHKILGGCLHSPEADTEIHYRTNQRDVLMAIATIKTPDASGAGTRALLSASTVAFLVVQVYGPSDPQLVMQELRLERQPASIANGSWSVRRVRSRSIHGPSRRGAGRVHGGARTERPAARPAPEPRRPVEPIGTVASYTAAIRKRRRRRRLRR